MTTQQSARPEEVQDAPFSWKIWLAVVFIAAAIAAALFYFNKQAVAQDVSAAQAVADKVVVAIEKRDGAAARALGDSTFKANNTDASLTELFKDKEVATLKKPQLDRHVVYTNKQGRTVYFIYKYTALKVPYFVRIGVHDNGAGNDWKLANLAGNIDESKLLSK
jgi:hypothetical protein